MPSVINIRQTITEYFSGDSASTNFTITHLPLAIQKITVDDNLLDESTYSLSDKVVKIKSAPARGNKNIAITYTYYSELPFIKGKDGKSVYEVAKENGYTGSEIDLYEALGDLDKFLPFTGNEPGLVPSGSNSNKALFLSGDGVWRTPSVDLNTALEDYPTEDELNKLLENYLQDKDLKNSNALAGILENYVKSNNKDTVLETVLNDGYYTKDAIDKLLDGYIKNGELDGNIGSDEVADLLANYVKNSELTETLKKYALLTELSNYYKKTEIDATLGDYYKKTEIDATLKSYTTNTNFTDLSNKVTNIENNYTKTSDLSDYAKTSDLTNYVKTTDLNSKLTSYAKTSDLSSYVKTTDLNSTLNSYAIKSTATTVTLSASGWEGTEAPYTYNASNISGITENGIVALADSNTSAQKEDAADALISVSAQSVTNKTITFAANGTKPTSNIVLQLVFFG